MERNGTRFTGDVVCTGCGVRLAPADQFAKADVKLGNQLISGRWLSLDSLSGPD
jgi:hypothetical protein